MKKLIQAACVAVVLGAGGAAMAEPAECTATNWANGWWDDSHPMAAAGRTMVMRDPRYGWRPCGLGVPAANAMGYPGNPGYIVVDPRQGLAYPGSAEVYPNYTPQRGDRDGDGVRNRQDRYPDDPRYR